MGKDSKARNSLMCLGNQNPIKGLRWGVGAAGSEEGIGTRSGPPWPFRHLGHWLLNERL